MFHCLKRTLWRDFAARNRLPGFSASRSLKRLSDITLAAAGLVFLAPLILTVVIAVRASARSPILIGAPYEGCGGKPIYLLSFACCASNNSMRASRSSLDARIGVALRRAGAEKLPWLLNVLAGDLSIVGPRPIRLEERRSSYHRRDIKPGLTGLAQINVQLENCVSLDTLASEATYNQYYADNRSLWLDLKILWRTMCAPGSYRLDVRRVRQDGQQN